MKKFVLRVFFLLFCKLCLESLLFKSCLFGKCFISKAVCLESLLFRKLFVCRVICLSADLFIKSVPMPFVWKQKSLSKEQSINV